MVFNSLQFLVFFMVVTLWFFQLRTQSQRILLLLVASCYFYMSFIPQYIYILGGTIIVDYFAGLQIERSEGRARKGWLVASLVANIGVLAVFKYYNFFLGSVGDCLQLFGKSVALPGLSMALPIGLSFHTFQAMSYTIEVYRGGQKAERNFIVYALYVMFYPQLVAGPIERPQHILPQLKEFREYNFDNVKEGIARMLWGFFKKVVIADRLAQVVNHTFGHVAETSSIGLAIGAIFYSFQIYCDFSGYSDIALGAAGVMNIKLMENFRQPYGAFNIANFWSRWHISLSSWFRDYLYIPLGGNRKGPLRRRLNILIVFLLSGLWHGANWTFVVWGLLHGLCVMVFAGSKRAASQGAGKVMAIVVNFLLVTLLWIFFRAENLGHALHYLQGIFIVHSGQLNIGMSSAELIFSVLVICFMLWRESRLTTHFISSNKSYGWYVAGMTIACYFLGVFLENQFIYFQF